MKITRESKLKETKKINDHSKYNAVNKQLRKKLLNAFEWGEKNAIFLVDKSEFNFRNKKPREHKEENLSYSALWIKSKIRQDIFRKLNKDLKEFKGKSILKMKEKSLLRFYGKNSNIM